MLNYKDTLQAIQDIELAIKEAESEELNSEERQDYIRHLYRLLNAYITEHRKAARRENQYAER